MTLPRRDGVHRRDVLGALVAATTSVALVSCGGDPNLVPVTARPFDPAQVDRDPLTLLPGGVVVLASADAKQLFATSIGADVDQLVRELVPLGPESNFEAARDVDRVTAGFYAMQGLDLCAVVQGRFDAAAIERAADARKVMPSGKPIVKTRYADQTMFTVGNLGFTVLTPKTMLSGNEVGMRRALDRMRYRAVDDPIRAEVEGQVEGVVARAVPGWMVTLNETPNAAFAMAGDFSTSSASEAATRTVPFLAGLDQARIIGNYQPPGLNFAGTLSYRDETSAETGGATLTNLNSAGQIANLWTSWATGTTIPSVDVRRSGKDLAFTTGVDEPTARSMLRLVADAAKRSF